MDDIVERLRKRAASERTPGGQLVYVEPAMLLAAADEIDRLRQRLDETALRYIEASNPGIDMDSVRRSRGGNDD